MTDTKPTDAAPIYRGMDRATLDAAYNNNAAVADSPEWLAKWRSRSAVVRAMPGARLDVPYGEREREKIDYLPSGMAGAPLFAFLHGGYWQRNAKDMFAFVAEGPLAHGIDVALVGYTLAPEVRLPDIVGEVAQALTFLHRNAATFGFDGERIIVSGWSAGGHLAAVACEQATVRVGLAISGIFDLEPIALSHLNEPLRLDRHEIETLSPARTLRSSMAPLHLAVGGNELSELQRQSLDFKARAGAARLPVTLGILPGHHHFSILDELARPDGALTGELRRLVAETPRRAD